MNPYEEDKERFAAQKRKERLHAQQSEYSARQRNQSFPSYRNPRHPELMPSSRQARVSNPRRLLFVVLMIVLIVWCIVRLSH
jgi:hypothetical protein